MKKGLVFLVLLISTLLFTACGQSNEKGAIKQDNTASAAETQNQTSIDNSQMDNSGEQDMDAMPSEEKNQESSSTQEKKTTNNQTKSNSTSEPVVKEEKAGPASTEKNKTESSENKNSGIVAGAVEPKLDLTIDGNTLTGTYLLKNQTEFVQTFKFSNSQRIGVLVKQGDQVVYDNRLANMYMQVIGEEKFIQGEEKSYDFQVNDLPKGKYTIDVWYTSQKGLFHVVKEFEITQELTEVGPKLDNNNTNQGIVAGAVEPKLELNVDGNTVKGSYMLKNQTEFVQTFKFSNSQRIGIIVKHDGEVIYDNRNNPYADVIGEEKLIQGEEKTYEFEVDNLEKGTYTINVWYVAQKGLFHIEKDFSIE